MAKGKSKVDFKQFLLKKGEYVAVGVAGLFLVILLGWGVSRGLGAKNPEDTAKKMSAEAQRVQSQINGTTISDADAELAQPPPWIRTKFEFKTVPASAFQLTGPPFDPTAKPNTKRENPVVLPLGNYQVDLTRVPMRGYDITFNQEQIPLIAVIVSKTINERDKEKLKGLGKTLSPKAQQAKEARERRMQQMQNQNPGGVGPGRPGVPGAPGGPGPMGSMGGPPGSSNPYGAMGGQGYDASAQRIEKSVIYVPLDELEAAVADGKVPAMTVIPLRMVTIHAEVPYKQQLEEIKRALRLSGLDEARKWGPVYDGYEVQRRVTRAMPDGTTEVITDWSEYKFEDKYIDLINSRKLADQVEDGYLSHFIRYDMNLALPLPQLVEELGAYPKIRLQSINDAIAKMKKANTKPVTPSDLLNRIGKKDGDRGSIYKPQTGKDTGADAAFGGSFAAPAGGPKGPAAGGGPGPMSGPVSGPMPAGGPGSFKPGDAGNQAVAPPSEVDTLLLRFVDVDVRPGQTYEYRIRLRMLNPNFEREKDVANPAYAAVKEMYSPWSQIRESITVPTESFLYAVDPAAYRKKVEDEYKDQKDLLDRLLWKPNQSVAVVEMCTWMEEVRTDAGGKREPVGAWVVADMPVGRGEYVGRKTYVKLPLWSSETNQYVLREVPDRIVTKPGPGGKEHSQPKGWLVDFTTRSVLVDFDGGRVTTRSATGGRTVTEDAATEMLIVRADGKLVVKSSLDAEQDKNRTEIVTGWEEWIKKVETRKGGGGGKDDDNPFLKKP